jgi:amino acid transporter
MAGYAVGLEENKTYVVALSLLILWGTLAGSVIGLATGKWISNTGALATYLAGALIVALGMTAWWRSGSATPMRILPHWDWGTVNFWSQIAFAFGGLELSAVLAGEIRDPRRTVARAAWIAGLAIAAFYILGTLALLVLLPPEEISIVTGLVQAGIAAGSAMGLPAVGWLLTVLVLVGVSGQLGAWISGSARLPFVIGLDRYLPDAFARLHPTWRTPYISILVQGAACTVFLLLLQAGENLRVAYQLLVDMAVITYFIPFLYLFGAAWRSGARLSAVCGLLVTGFSIAISAIPPSGTASLWLFEFKLLGGCAALVLTGRMVYTLAIRRA